MPPNHDPDKLALIQLIRNRLDPVISYTQTVVSDGDSETDIEAINDILLETADGLSPQTTTSANALAEQLQDQGVEVSTSNGGLSHEVETILSRALAAHSTISDLDERSLRGVDPDSILAARDQQVADEGGDVITVVPWAEAIAYMSEATGHAVNVNPLFLGGYRLAFKQYAQTKGLDPESHFPASLQNGPIVPANMDEAAVEPSSSNDMTATGIRSLIEEQGPDAVKFFSERPEHWQFVEYIRTSLKHARDKVFLSVYYDHLDAIMPGITDGVPKTIWDDALIDLQEDADHSPTPELGDVHDPNGDGPGPEDETADEQAATNASLDMF